MPTQTIEDLAERLGELEQNIDTLNQHLTEVIGALRTEIAGSVRTEHLNLANPNIGEDLSVESTGSGALSIRNQHGSLEIGPRNEWWSHFITSQPKYYFDKRVAVNGGQIGSYEGDLVLQTSMNTGGDTRMVLSHDTGHVGIGTPEPTEPLHVHGNAQVDGLVKITTATGSVTIGSQNQDWCHFYTDRGMYYFDKEIRVNSGRISSYDEDLVLSTGSDPHVTIRKDTGDLVIKKGLAFENGGWKIETIDSSVRGIHLIGTQMNIKHGDRTVLTLNNGNMNVPGLSVDNQSIFIGGVEVAVVEAERYTLQTWENGALVSKGAYWESHPGGDWKPTGVKRKTLKVGGAVVD